MVSNKSELWQMLVPTWDEENEIKMMTLQSCGFHFHCVSVLLFFHFLHFLPFVECKFVHFVSVVIVILHLLLLLYLFGYFLLSFIRFHLHRYLLNWLDSAWLAQHVKCKPKIESKICRSDYIWMSKAMQCLQYTSTEHTHNSMHIWKIGLYFRCNPVACKISDRIFKSYFAFLFLYSLIRCSSHKFTQKSESWTKHRWKQRRQTMNK